MTEASYADLPPLSNSITGGFSMLRRGEDTKRVIPLNTRRCKKGRRECTVMKKVDARLFARWDREKISSRCARTSAKKTLAYKELGERPGEKIGFAGFLRLIPFREIRSNSQGTFHSLARNESFREQHLVQRVSGWVLETKYALTLGTTI